MSSPPPPPSSNVIEYASAFLKLNISGKRYKILKRTAARCQNSLLAELASIDADAGEKMMISRAAASCYYLVDNKEFYLERCPLAFDLILQYVYTGELHCPSGVCCKRMLISELRFWRLISSTDGDGDKEEEEEEEEVVQVAECCATDGGGKKADDDQEDEQDDDDEAALMGANRNSLLGKLWMTCENPSSSIAASLLSVVSIMFILVSIVNLLLSTVKSLQHCDGGTSSITNSSTTSSNYSNNNQTTSADSAANADPYCDGGPVFDAIEAVCIGWFTLELIVRFIACPRKRLFFRSALNIIDLLSTVPFYLELMLPHANGVSMIYVLRVLRILRIMRALRLARYFESVRIMGETFKKCRKDFGVLIVFILMAMIIGSSVVYQFEKDEKDTQFTSIPASFWWCIVTLTTVGYGDTFPTTTTGRAFTGVVCVIGVILLAMPISIMVEQFSEQYKSRNKKAAKLAKAAKVLKKAVSGGGGKQSKSIDTNDQYVKLIK